MLAKMGSELGLYYYGLVEVHCGFFVSNQKWVIWMGLQEILIIGLIDFIFGCESSPISPNVRSSVSESVS